MKKTESAGGIVMNARGEIALVLHGSDRNWWGFPKGHLDKGEGALDAAKREIAEETGIRTVRMVRSLGSYERLSGGGHEYKTIHMFLFTTDQEEMRPIDPSHPEARWVSKLEVERLLSHPKDAEFYKSILPTLD